MSCTHDIQKKEDDRQKTMKSQGENDVNMNVAMDILKGLLGSLNITLTQL
jgi:hypothetical protein